jgi:hypothetical protein
MAAFVLGNGRSRLALDLAILAKQGTIYGCNALYREFVPNVLVATDRPIATSIQQSGYSAQYRFHTRKPIPGLGAQPVPQKYFGFSSGPLATVLAAMDGHDSVYLVGFDMGPMPGDLFNNVYADTEFYKKSSARPTYTGNWVRQLTHVARDFPRVRFIRVHGETTAPISQFDSISNMYQLGLEDLRERLNTSKDL